MNQCRTNLSKFRSLVSNRFYCYYCANEIESTKSEREFGNQGTECTGLHWIDYKISYYQADIDTFLFKVMQQVSHKKGSIVLWDKTNIHL